MTEWVAFSVDLEPNKDDTLDGVAEAMHWFDDVVPRGTVYATHRIATELPEVVADLAADHEIGVHVHPREFGHEHDQLAELDADRQRELIRRTRSTLAEAASVDKREVTAFRAGRHSASETTFDVLQKLGFEVDASINVRYTDYLPESLTARQKPFTLDSGLFELPTTYARPPLLSRVGLRLYPNRELTATANTLRSDRRGCSGLRALAWLRDETTGLSMYMHPYDATDHHADLENTGSQFRNRIRELFEPVNSKDFVSAGDLVKQR
ncbi:polysaccharide deacetylase family protein [Halomicroarcula sp. F28]|uniref:polysaccharide deacetylase family protein n=1 Tax=Haloarcula salinisoli TaxID=2487746 RepID=UPI001C73332B|nr:polysaccharide deacetylase family protein [Halomicroarcula salinisoli]MBX0285481.1 polysaccharide deacetylase family protein [Halomicroarcula salinisoli]